MRNEDHKSFHIRAFPVELRHRLHELAARKRMSLRELVIGVLEDMADRELELAARQGNSQHDH